MPTTAKLTVALALTMLAATVLAGCTATGGTTASEQATKPAAVETTPAAEPSPTPAPVETPKDPCPSPRPKISLLQDGEQDGFRYNPDGGPAVGILEGELVDLGPRKFAEGTVNRNGAGDIVSYTVAPGDVYDLIYPRFCFRDYYSIISYNTGFEPLRSRPTYRGLEPGDVLVLRPDPTARWLPHID